MEMKYREIPKNVEEILNSIKENLDLLFRTLLNSPLVRTAINPSNQLRVTAENIPAPWIHYNYPTSGAPYIANGAIVPVWIGPVDQRWMIIQMANIEYNECQRSRFTFV